jgi:hypothetical protein
MVVLTPVRSGSPWYCGQSGVEETGSLELALAAVLGTGTGGPARSAEVQAVASVTSMTPAASANLPI